MPAKEAHTAVYDYTSNRMIVFSGGNHDTVSPDVWVLTNANGLNGTPAWIQLALGADSGEGNRLFRTDADNLSSSAKPAVLC